MKRWMYAALTVIALTAGFLPGRAGAQQQGPFGRPPGSPFGTPTTSPFLGLGLGTNPAIGNYGVNWPQQQMQQPLGQIQQEPLLLEQATLGGGLQGQGLAGQYITGHQARFMNFSHYYPPSVLGIPPRR